MIIGTICLVWGIVSTVLMIPALFIAFKTYSNRALLVGLVCVAGFHVGLVVGLSTYECAPNSPTFQMLGPCQGGVPWP